MGIVPTPFRHDQTNLGTGVSTIVESGNGIVTCYKQSPKDLTD
jgi:hypothetical protein